MIERACFGEEAERGIERGESETAASGQNTATMITRRGARLENAQLRAIVVAPDPAARPRRRRSRRHRPRGVDASQSEGGIRFGMSLQVRQRSRQADQPRRFVWLWKGRLSASVEHQVFVARWRRSSCYAQSRPTSQSTERLEERKRLRLCHGVIQADRRGIGQSGGPLERQSGGDSRTIDRGSGERHACRRQSICACRE